MKLTKKKLVGEKLVLLISVILVLFAALPTVAFCNTMIHNSTNLGTTYGDWGVPGGLYGEFTCGTCHTRNTGNIKRIKKDLVAPNSPSDQFPIEGTGNQVNLQTAQEGSSDFGDDSVAGKIGDALADNESDKICESCHTQTKFHNYDANQNVINDPVDGTRDHYNQADCMICHPHSQGFKPQACDSCHGYPPSNAGELANSPIITNSSTAGAHDKHVGLPLVSCDNCHNGYSMPQNSTVNSPDLTSQGDISIGFNFATSNDGSYGGQLNVSYNQSEGDGTLTCSAVYCHGSTLSGTNPTWNGGPGSIGCGDCHDAAALTVSGLPTGASHNQHANTLGLDCSKCHGSGYTAGASAPVAHVTGNVSWDLDTADTRFGALTTYNTAAIGASVGLAPSASYGQCDNLYCHSSGQDSTGGPLGAGEYPAGPVWGGSAPCGSCHSTTTLASGSHNAHLTYTDTTIGCDQCHTGAASDALSYPSANHVNELIDVAPTYTQSASHAPGNGYGDCSATYCHGSGTPTWGGATLNCDSCHDADNSGDLSAGHAVHFNTATPPTAITDGDNHAANAYAFGCNNCHPTASHAAGSADPGVQDAEINGAKLASVDYTQGPSTLSDARAFEYSVGGSCATLCHTRDGATAGSATTGNPAWNDSNAVGCGFCHSQAGDVAPTWSTPHAKHINDYSANTNFTCNACHSVTATNNGTINGVAGRNQHPNQTKNIDLNTFADGSWSGTQCSNTYCHSDASAASPTHAAISWSGTMACNSCHNDAAALATNAHDKHLSVQNGTGVGRDIQCNECHIATTPDNDGPVTITNHVNKLINVKFDDSSVVKDLDTPTYNAVSTTGAGSTMTPGSATGSCASVYCHSAGNLDGAGGVVDPGTAFNTVAWNATGLDCTSCHGTATTKAHPDYVTVGGAGSIRANTHVKHVEDSNMPCYYCHDATTSNTAVFPALPTDLLAAGAHLDRVETVSFNSAVVGAAASYNPAVGTKSCSTTYCHGGGTPPQWGGAALNCNDCHEASSALAGSHGVHYNTATVVTSNSTGRGSDATRYLFNCGNCHNGNTHAGGEATPTQAAAEVSLTDYAIGTTPTADSRGFNYTDASCGTNLCHNDGTGISGAPRLAPVWGATTLDCTGCHNGNASAAFKMASGAHTKHMNGGGSVMTDKECATCHNATVSAGSDILITDKDLHINQLVNVAILGTYDGNGATDNFATNQCSSIYCHSDGKSVATPNYANTIDWDAGTTTCTSCHGGANASVGGNNAASSALSASHTVHTGPGFGYTCDDCHTQTASSNAAIGTAANHVNQLKDVAVDVSNGGDGNIGGNYEAVTAGSCATTNCHGTASTPWATVGTSSDCSLCHGMVTSATDDRDTNGDVGDNTDAEVGAHEAHLNATHGYTDPIACDECHVDPNATVGTYVDKVKTAGHMDGTAAMAWGDLADGNDDGQTRPAPVSCATTYCHDSSKLKHNYGGTGAVTPVWNVPNLIGDISDCNNCHGYPPQGAHAGYGNDCSNCHTHVVGTDDGFSNPSLHMDGTVQGSSDSCAGCHSSLSTSHSAHVDSSYFLDGKTISGGDYGKAAGSGTNGFGWYDVEYVSGVPLMGCGQCHPNTQASHPSGGGAEIDIDPAGELAELTPLAPNPKLNNSSPSYISNQCSGVYCHSDGAGNFDATPPAWGIDTIDDCKGCHGNSPTTNAHNLHEVGIHYETLLDDDRVGLMAKSTDDTGVADGEGGNYGAGAAHGNSAQTTTLTCYTCHKDTVADTANAGNTTCAGCHSDTGSIITGDELGRIASDSWTHINGQADVSFVDLSTFKSKAQLRNDITNVAEVDASWARYNSAGLDNTAYKQATSYDLAKNTAPIYNSADLTCSTVDCHNGIKTPTWDSTSDDCMSCHTQLPQ